MGARFCRGSAKWSATPSSPAARLRNRPDPNNHGHTRVHAYGVILMRMKPLAFACALAIAALSAPPTSVVEAAAEGTCPANAKKANLNFTMKDLDGKPVRLSDYQGK